MFWILWKWSVYGVSMKAWIGGVVHLDVQGDELAFGRAPSRIESVAQTDGEA